MLRISDGIKYVLTLDCKFVKLFWLHCEYGQQDMTSHSIQGFYFAKKIKCNYDMYYIYWVSYGVTRALLGVCTVWRGY